MPLPFFFVFSFSKISVRLLKSWVMRLTKFSISSLEFRKAIVLKRYGTLSWQSERRSSMLLQDCRLEEEERGDFKSLGGGGYSYWMRLGQGILVMWSWFLIIYTCCLKVFSESLRSFKDCFISLNLGEVQESEEESWWSIFCFGDRGFRLVWKGLLSSPILLYLFQSHPSPPSLLPFSSSNITLLPTELPLSFPFLYFFFLLICSLCLSISPSYCDFTSWSLFTNFQNLPCLSLSGLIISAINCHPRLFTL